MLSVHAMSRGDQRYYLELTNINYYVEGGEPEGRWWGACRKEFDLFGKVEKEHLSRLCEGLSHTDADERLVRNAGKESRRPGFDLTYSCPKSVSIIWAMGPEELRAAIQRVTLRAVLKSLTYLEDACGWARTGAQGQVIQKAPLLFALFEHGMSRALDPQLHVHALLINLTKLFDGKTRAVDPTQIYHHQMAAGALFRCELAAGLRELGFSIKPVQHGGSVMFEVEGVSEDVIDYFSKRRAEIEEKLELELGSLDVASATAAEIAALETRRKKDLEKPRAEMFPEWQEVGKRFGVTPEYVTSLRTREQTLSPEQRERINETLFERAVGAIEETQSNFAERDLVRKVAEHAQGALSSDEVRELVEEKIQLSGRIVVLGDAQTENRSQKQNRYVDRLERQYATREMLALERGVHELAERLVRRPNETPREFVEAAIKANPKLSPEQADAVRHLCSGGSLRLVTGDAGTGKSFMLRACDAAWKAERKRVFGCALAGAAADELERSSGVKSTTLHSLLARLEHGRLTLDGRSVVVLDEAGMVGSRLFSRLVREVAKSGAKLVCVGDAKQLAPIEAGWIFKRMSALHGEARLTHVRRQEVPWQLDAGRLMGQGESLKALMEYQAHERLTVSKTTRVAVRELVSQWEKDGGARTPENKLILASTNAEVREINRQCQARRLLLPGANTDRKVFHEGAFFYEGDRVLFSKRMTKQKIENSWVGTVEKADERGELTVKLDKDGRLVTIRLKTLPKDALKHGWASTTHKAQGKTIDLCYVLMGGPLTNLHIGYVQTTRHRKDVRLYLSERDAGPDFRVAAKALAKIQNKALAVEIIEQHERQRLKHERGMSLGM